VVRKLLSALIILGLLAGVPLSSADAKVGTTKTVQAADKDKTDKKKDKKKKDKKKKDKKKKDSKKKDTKKKPIDK
jgi:hypothetical protein